MSERERESHAVGSATTFPHISSLAQRSCCAELTGLTDYPIFYLIDVTIEDVLSVNHGLRQNEIEEGQTILLPSNKLSERDREILDGVKTKGHRAYPVRKGETIEDIIEKRGIKMQEVEALNEGVDLSSLKGE